MSTDLEETEVETEEAETEMIVLSNDKMAANDALITRLTNDWLPLKCNGADDLPTFKIVDDARKRMVKYRTGLAKQVKDLVKPLKDEIKRIDAQADKYQAKLSVVEDHLKAEVAAVNDEIARREQERADELYDLRKRRWLEATGNPPDFDGAFPEAYLRALDESGFEAEIQRLAEKTRRDREETIRKLEAEAAETKRRNEEAARIAEENRKLHAEREAFEQERRKAKAEADLVAQQQREAQAKIDAETRRLDSERRAKEEADKPVAGGNPTSPSRAGDAPAAAPSEPPPFDSMESTIDSLQRHGLPNENPFVPEFAAAIPVVVDAYDCGYIDGLTWGMRYSKNPPSAIEALVANRKNTAGYKP